MELKKAIEILELMGTPDFDGHTEDILAARKLGTEALKLLVHSRILHVLARTNPLPSETPSQKDK